MRHRRSVMFVTAIACLNILRLSSSPARNNGQRENSPRCSRACLLTSDSGFPPITRSNGTKEIPLGTASYSSAVNRGHFRGRVVDKTVARGAGPSCRCTVHEVRPIVAAACQRRLADLDRSRLFFRPQHGSQRPHWLAGHVGFEPANQSASYLIGDNSAEVNASPAAETLRVRAA